ncbi:MAG: hypothetical protein HZA14_11800 [Nitrospirae bacterium]|nr:hypothetical protein [Nitrospirota bacterium]
MKGIIKLTVVLMLILFAVPAIAGNTDTPVVDKKQENQEQRIEQGIASGELTKKEAVRLEREQAKIEKEEKAFKADGVLTKQERGKLHHDLNKSSRHIYKEKHDGRHRR